MVIYRECPRCGGDVELARNAMTDAVWRTYTCDACNWSTDVKQSTAPSRLTPDNQQAWDSELAAPDPARRRQTRQAIAIVLGLFAAYMLYRVIR